MMMSYIQRWRSEFSVEAYEGVPSIVSVAN